MMPINKIGPVNETESAVRKEAIVNKIHRNLKTFMPKDFA
jgi:hypothetical protein